MTEKSSHWKSKEQESRETSMEQPEIYSREYYQQIYNLETRHWWHVGMRRIAETLVRSQGRNAGYANVLDAGCGTGATMTWARDAFGGQRVVGVDISLHAIQFCRSRCLVHSSQGSVLDMPFQSETFDLMFCWDVLQHLPTDGGDVRALKEMLRVLRPGGMLLVRANSRLGMWHDEAAKDEDFQRYTLPEVVSRMEEAGFVVQRATYANCLPALYGSFAQWRKTRARRPEEQHRVYEGFGVRDTAAQRPLINRILLQVLKAEALYLSLGKRNVGFGHTTLCLGQKPTG